MNCFFLCRVYIGGLQNIMDKVISVIIPVYNIEKYLVRCLESVINQSYTNLEIILIDDGSTDNSGKICDNYKKQDNRIIVVHKKNEGVSQARNLGISIATGEFLSFVDGDDTIEKDMFFTLINNAYKYNADFSCCGVRFIYMDGKESPERINLEPQEIKKQEIIKGFFCDQQMKLVLYGPYNKIIKRNSIQNIAFNRNLSLGEDLLFVFKCIQCCSKFVFQDDNLYNYIKREGSATTREFSLKKMDYLVACKKIIEICKEYYPEGTKFANHWYYINVLNHVRMLIAYPEVKGKCLKEYKRYCEYLKENKKIMWNQMTKKNKLTYYLIFIFPYSFRLLKKIGYNV